MGKTHDEKGGQELDDTQLLGLEQRLNELVAELLAIEHLSDRSVETRFLHFPRLWLDRVPNRRAFEEETNRAEAILARLYPVELAIMQTPAHTLCGLGVKARHAAYVMSQYWDAPLDQIEWEARAVRLLIEAVCKSAGMSLPSCCAMDARC